MTALDTLLKNDTSRNIFLKGLNGSGPAMTIASLFTKGRGSYVCVLNDQEEAGYFYHDLMQLTASNEVYFFPSAYRRAIKYGHVDPANEILRTEVLSRLQDPDASFVIVTYPDALAERVVAREVLKENTLKISVGEKLVCLKNPNYYRTAAHIDGFEVRCVSDASTQEIAFRNKELSIFTISNAETLANYKDNDEYQVVSYPDGRITFMEINPNSEAMSTMEARQAVIYALDLDALVYGTYGDEALCRTATSILSTVSMFYNPEITNYKQDLDKAAQLIEQTGLKDKTIKIIYNSARVGQEELATMIKSQLDAVGLNAQIDSMETAAYFKSYFYATDSYDIALMGNGMLDDPSGFVGLFAHTRSGANMYTTDEVDSLWAQLDREMDPAVRQDIMNQGLQALKDCWSCVPVLDTNYVCAAQKNIGGFEASDRLTDLTQIYFIG